MFGWWLPDWLSSSSRRSSLKSKRSSISMFTFCRQFVYKFVKVSAKKLRTKFEILEKYLFVIFDQRSKSWEKQHKKWILSCSNFSFVLNSRANKSRNSQKTCRSSHRCHRNSSCGMFSRSKRRSMDFWLDVIKFGMIWDESYIHDFTMMVLWFNKSLWAITDSDELIAQGEPIMNHVINWLV